MQFLGTAAADMIPNPFCTCPICEDARKDASRGRLRSAFLLDEENLIDFGPDLGAAAMRHNVELSKLKNVFITHTHEDHFEASNVSLMQMSVTRERKPLRLYCSDRAYETLQRRYAFLPEESGENIIEAHVVKVGETFRAGTYEVLPVLTTHHANERECAINYRFKKDGRSLLYACDTGYYIPESLEMLRDSKLDTLILEGTWGSVTTMPMTSHLHGPAFIEQLEIFYRYGIIRSDTAIYCTHINHKHEWNHEAYQRFFDTASPFRVTVARDGMKLDL